MNQRLVLAPEAREDIRRILVWSVEHFGPTVRDGYEALITTALADIAADPARAGSSPRPELGDGFRTWHLSLSRDHVPPGSHGIAKPRHFVVYRLVGTSIHIDRVLHDAVDPQQHLMR